MSTIASATLVELAYEWCTEFEHCIETEVQLSPSDVADTENDTESELFTGNMPVVSEATQ
ncbi:hypothetical protein [Rhodococcus sp. NPDC049939]|uniref:hypothetical protein n=1 Tax=Rhodococcus sp. NPDC049939 TaxID=3155511 RepID=UPI0033F266B5